MFKAQTFNNKDIEILNKMKEMNYIKIDYAVKKKIDVHSKEKPIKLNMLLEDKKKINKRGSLETEETRSTKPFSSPFKTFELENNLRHTFTNNFHQCNKKYITDDFPYISTEPNSLPMIDNLNQRPLFNTLESTNHKYNYLHSNSVKYKNKKMIDKLLTSK